MLFRSEHVCLRGPDRVMPDEPIERQLNERRAQLVPFMAVGVDAIVPRYDGAHVSLVSA